MEIKLDFPKTSFKYFLSALFVIYKINLEIYIKVYWSFYVKFVIKSWIETFFTFTLVLRPILVFNSLFPV